MLTDQVSVAVATLLNIARDLAQSGVISVEFAEFISSKA